MDYVAIYERAGNKRDGNGGMHIPIFTCAKAFGEAYARSISFGLSKIFNTTAKSFSEVTQQVYHYLLMVCARQVGHEDIETTYREVVMGLAYSKMSVFALSYKHKVFGGPYGRRQRLTENGMRVMASEIVQHAQATGTELFCFWLDQILGQRKPKSERRWVDNGLLPYAMFNTIVFDYTTTERGAWLLSELLLAQGRRNTSRQGKNSRLVIRDRLEGGPDSLMRAASAIACGVIDEERGDLQDKISIVNWALETLDMSAFVKGIQIEHFTRLMYARKPWDRVRLSSVMFNLEILPKELERSNREHEWKYEEQLLSNLIPSDLRSLCDGSWLSKVQTKVYKTNVPNKFVFFQHFYRSIRDSLLIIAVVSKAENTPDNHVMRYTAIAFDELSNDEAAEIVRNERPRIEWSPVYDFLRRCGISSHKQITEFGGCWLGGDQA